MNLRDEWAKINNEKIKEVERTVYGGDMPLHNKQALRFKLNKEDREVLKEELDHSHSPVGDWNGMEVKEY